MEIIRKNSHLFRQNPELKTEEIDNKTVYKITFFLVNSYYGKTKIRVREWYDNGKLVNYRYCWEKNRKKPGHISAWENEEHEVPHSVKIETIPHHHHYVPGDRTQVQNNRSIRNLNVFFETIEPYIVSGIEYDGKEV